MQTIKCSLRIGLLFFVLTFGSLLLCILALDGKSLQANNNNHQLSSTDQTVMNTILGDMVSENKKHGDGDYGVVLEITKLSVHPPYKWWDVIAPHPDLLFTDKLNEADKDFQLQNKIKSSWQNFKPLSDSIRVADLNPMRAKIAKLSELDRVTGGARLVFFQMFPKYSYYVSFCQPGYSNDGQFAYVSYEKQPIRHREWGRYFLQKQGEKWIIIFHDMAKSG